MSNRLSRAHNPVTHCERRSKVRRTWGGTVLTVLTLLALAALVGWLLSLIRTGISTGDNGDNEGYGFRALLSLLSSVPIPGLAMAPVWQGSFLAGLALTIIVVVALAVRKVRSDDAFYASLRREEDVFAPLREPGRAVPPADAQRILVACAAEARLIMQHVRRAQRTLSVEDYDDELMLAERKLDGVIRCVEELAERMLAYGTHGTHGKEQA